MAALAVLWVASQCLKGTPPSGTTLIGTAVFLYAAWIVGTNSWANQAYTAAAPFHAAFLFGGFLFGRRAGPGNAQMLFGTALAFAAGLAGWALWQRTGQGVARVQALFETPSTLASTLNLVLLPGLVLVAWGKRNILLVSALVIIVAALAAAASRGGWLALGAGGVIAFAFGRSAGVRIDRKSSLIVLAIVAAGLTLAWLAPLAWDWTAKLGSSAASIPSKAAQYSMITNAPQSSAARLGLYELAMNGISPSHWLTGYGYLGFYYLMEIGRQTIPSYGGATTYFVHNDYLQTLLELGIPGLIGLLAVVVWPLVVAWRAAPRMGVNLGDGLVLVALVASLGSMAAHALVDFPFYIPVCLLIYGAALGLLDSTLLRADVVKARRFPESARAVRMQGAIGAAVATLALWILAMPVVAQAAAGYAQRQWQAAQGQSAAYWFEVARRLQPRDWRYHWYAGQFWYLQAAQSRKPAAAELADQAFAAGDAANSREVRNLLGRIATNRELRALLPAPAEATTLLAWTERALLLAPLNPGANIERALVLKQFGSSGKEPK